MTAGHGDEVPVDETTVRTLLAAQRPEWADLRARAWAVAVGISGVVSYRDSYPAFVAECRARLRAIQHDAVG